MTRSYLALAAGLLTVTAFVAGHQVAQLDPSPAPASQPAALAVPARPASTAKAIAPDPTKPAPKGIQLGDPSDCSFGGTCLSEKYHLMPLRG